MQDRDRVVSENEYEDEEVPDSEEDEEDEDEDYEDTNTHNPRRSSRTATVSSRTKAVKNLPFSPRKRTRSMKAYPDGDSEDELGGFDQEESGEVVEIPTRRSTRARKSAKANLADADAYEDEGDDDDSTHRTGRGNRVEKRKDPRGKASRPAYGHIRSVADLDYDPYSDEETLPLRAHREECEKCRRQPAHILMEAMRKQVKGKGRKKKISDDEDEGDEQERLVALGGWVRWLVDLLFFMFNGSDLRPSASSVQSVRTGNVSQ
jgi:chromodomain-helicase-DNA-binding protein 4